MNMIPINPQNVLKHEWIGLKVKAINGEKEIVGKIVDETKHTFIMEQLNGVEKKIVKNQTQFILKLSNQTVKVDGKAMELRSHDRVKGK